MQSRKVNLHESETSDLQLLILKEVKAGKLNGDTVGIVTPAPFRFLVVVLIFTFPLDDTMSLIYHLEQMEGSFRGCHLVFPIVIGLTTAGQGHNGF